MTSMKDGKQVEVTCDADAVTSELYVENTIQNPVWYTVEDNHVSLVPENVEKCIKFETDMLDDCMWESRIEITKYVANQSNMELSLECQDVTDNIYLNHGNTSNKIFHCIICGKNFVSNYLLKNHMAEHKRQVNYKTNKCKFCGKLFKFKFGLNEHIKKHHNSMYRCRFCKLFIDCSKYIEHKQFHERKDQTKFDDTIPNLKLCKLNGVWKSEFKCNICFQICYSEENLVEHMETHDNCQTQCNDCLDCVSVSELNNHMENIHNKHFFKCQKCNQQFQKQRHLNCHLIHCLRSSHTKFNKVCGKVKAIEKTCSACGIVFNNTLSLKNHTTIGCNHFTCKYCGKHFNKRNFWLKHMDVHKKVEQCARLKLSTDKTSATREYNQTEFVNDSFFNTNGRQFSSRDILEINSSDHTTLVNSNATIVSTAPHTYIPNNDITSYPGQTEILSNTLERNSSDQIEDQLVSSDLFPEPVPFHVIQNKIWNIKQERFFQTTVRNHFQQKLNKQESNVLRHNAISNNDSPVLNMMQEINFRTTVGETNSSDQIYLANRNESIVSTASQNSMVNTLNIKQEKNMCIDVRESNSSDQGNSVSSNESTLANEPRDLMAKQNPINIPNNNIVYTVRETPYFCIRKLPNIKNGFCSDGYDQTSQNNVIFLCRICRNSSSSDIHSFALHMSDHRECNMHECIVCDETFNSVILWAAHMTYHQQQIDLNVSTVQMNLLETESNTLDPINSRNMEPQDYVTMSRKHKKDTKSSSIKKMNFCNLCNRKFTKRCYFTNHMMMKHKIKTNTPKPLISIDGNESIIKSENIELTDEYENKLSVPVDNKNDNLNNHDEKKSKCCIFCKKHFAHLGALTNHMRIHGHKIYKCQYCFMEFSRKGLYIMHEKTHVLKNVVKRAPSQNKNNIVFEVNDEPQIEHCNGFEIMHSPVDGNSRGTNLTDIEHFWFPCDVCEKKFSTPFQLNVHRYSHSGIVPFVCKICNRSYELRFRWNAHLKAHYKRHNSNLKKKQHTKNLKPNISKPKIESVSHKDKIKCRYCKKEYNLVSQWKKHMSISKECRRHCKSYLPEISSNKATKNSSKTGRFRCNICMKTFSTSLNRTKHKKNIHNLLNETYLNTYGNIGLQKDKLMDIIQQKPSIKKRNKRNGAKCDICGKIYYNRANLSRHISIIHAQTYEPMTCYDCGSTFKHEFSYIEHLRTKHKHFEETNSTDQRTSGQITSVNKKNIMKYICKICKIKFADNITLQKHTKIHTLNMYTCNDCGEQYETNLALGNHIWENHNTNINSASNKN